ncbi:MAG: LptF/LptG family permease [Ignavibacteriae bacterium]|nr:LptF/LptG family permease [Ignavibacteriota bacterium]MCB9243231.1 LptF/LptG family permease [Ignavibacteriales bacterium]
MKILDKYILRNFVINFLFGILCFVIIFIAVDLIENLDKFIDKNVPTDIIIRYYIYFIPEILKLITPMGMLLASLFTISRFISYSEFTAMQSAGIGLARYLAPILVFGFMMTGFSIYFNGWVVPDANSSRLQLDRQYLGKNVINASVQNLHIQEKNNRIITIGFYDDASRTGRQISIQSFDKNDITHLISRFDIQSFVWDSAKADWKLSNVYERVFGDSNKIDYKQYSVIYTGDIKDLGKISLTPDLIIKNQLMPEEMTLSDHREFIDNLKASGLESAKTEVDYYSKISFSFANIVTILFGASISANSRRRGGAALQFGIAIMVSFIYLGFIKISQVFGYNGDINPVLTAWMANIIFIGISLVNFWRLQRE